MEIRRVQFTGGSSYVLTLPKEWVEARKIKKNDPIGIEVQADGTLLVTTALDRETDQKIREFDLEGITDRDYLFRLLIGAYISGYTTIVIRHPERLPPFVRAVVRDFTQMTIGQEVIEESGQSITLKDLLNPAEMPFANTIKRMFVIVKAMHEDVIAAIVTRNTRLLQDVSARDNDVDRLHWLIARQTNMILSNATLSRRMGIAPVRAVYFYVISRIIERIGDHAERIAENAKGVVTKTIDPETIGKLAQAGGMSMEIFERSLVSFFDNDLQKAHRNIESLRTLEKVCDQVNEFVVRQETPDAIALGYIVESIRRSGEYSVDISENVINYLVDHEQPGLEKKGQKKRG